MPLGEPLFWKGLHAANVSYVSGETTCTTWADAPIVRPIISIQSILFRSHCCLLYNCFGRGFMSQTSQKLLQHEAGIYGRLSQQIALRMKELSPTAQFDCALAHVLQRLGETVDDESYAKIQRQFTAEGVIDERWFAEKIPVEQHRQLLKYLNAVYWIEAKLRAAWHLGLHKSPPVNVLDIGTGCGHFAFVCRCFGHECLGTDLPDREDFTILQMFKAICHLLGVPRVEHEIHAREPLPSFGRKFEVTVALMANFSVYADGEPWHVEDWRFFLSDLRDTTLAKEGVIYMSIGRHRLSEEAWDYLVSVADWVHPTSRQVRLSSKLSEL
jgi:hypothetical protein